MFKLLFALALALGAPMARADDITLTNGEWLPFMSEHLPQYGVISRIVSEAFALEGVTVHYVFRPWPRALAEAQRGLAQGSIIWSEGAPGSQRLRDFYFSSVVLEDQLVFFHRTDRAFTWETFADLANYRIGGVAGYEYRFEDVPGLRVDRAPTDELSLRKLLAGRIDAFPSSQDVGMYLLRTRFTPEEAARITVFKGAAYSSTRYHLILPRSLADSPAYLERFNRGLRRLKESGRYAKYMADLKAGRY
jgi:polar amino acid transport system substrate-binding protein